MNFDNGQSIKFGVSNYGPGLANNASVCHFQYLGMGEAPGAMKPGPGVQQMQVERNSFVPNYHNVALSHHQGSPPGQAGFPMGMNMTMSSQMSFNSLPPMESFGGHGQGFPGNQRQGMNYKNFSWVGPNQNNQNSLPSIGHLWSHFQQQQMQKHSVQQHTAPHQQNYYPNQQQMQSFPNAISVSQNIAGPRGQSVGYQFQTQNPAVVNHSRIYQTFAPDRVQNCVYGSQNAPIIGPNVPIVSDASVPKTSQPPANPPSRLPAPPMSAICNQVTNTTTTITMTNCSSSPLTTAMAHVTMPSVVTAVAGSKCLGGGGSQGRGCVPVSAAGCVSRHSQRRVSDGADSESAECDQDSFESKEIEQSLHIVKVPFGWRRTTEDGKVVYYSPSSTRLSSFPEVCKYLAAEGTCKCGLECPLMVEKVFNFDPLVDGKLWTVDDMAKEDLTKWCIHKRKIIAMATFQISRTMPQPVSKSPDRVNRTRKGKKNKSKAKSAPYDGLLVSQLLSQKGNVIPPLNHPSKQKMPVTSDSSQNPLEGLISLASNSVTPVSSAVPKMFENKSVPCKVLHQLEKCNNVLSNTGPDPADDLGPITCQVPAKLDFSKEVFDNHKLRVQSSLASHSVGQGMFHPGSVSPQTFIQEPSLKHPSMMSSQSPSPRAPTASPSLVPNHLYGPNVPQHFQCQMPMNVQQTPGNIMFQALMQVQNPQAPRFVNSPIFEQANMQANHMQSGPQQNLLINQGYPHVNDLAWLEPGKPKTKRPRSKKDKQKLNSILDRTSPCPNVDVRHIPQEASKNPSTVNANVSFMENPAAFLAQQTALVHSSMSNTKTDVSQPCPRTLPSKSIATSLSNQNSPPPTTSASSQEQKDDDSKKVLSQAVTSISQSETSVASSGTDVASAVGDSSVVNASSVENANCDKSSKPPKPKRSSDSDSSPDMCCDENARSTPVSGESSPTSNAKGVSKESESGDSNVTNDKNIPMPNASQPEKLSVSTTASVPQSANSVTTEANSSGNSAMPNNISELLAANSLNINAVQHALSQQAEGDFPASSLLSAAARAQISQSNPLGVLFGQQMQLNPSLQVSAGQETTTANTLPEMMSKAGMSPLDQLNLSLQQQAGGTLVLPQNPNILTGALPGSYINTLNGPAVPGLPLNMFLPVNQAIGNTASLNPAQNLLIGLDPKSVPNPQTSKQSLTNARVSGTDSSKGMDCFNGSALNYPALFTNVAGVPTTIGANFKPSSTTSNGPQAPAGVSSPLMNSQFPFVTMNTPMPPMSLPLVTNVTNSLSQVIPAVGVAQTVLNQNPVTQLLGTVTVPTLNNSVVIANQIPSIHSSQTTAQNLAFMGVQPQQSTESNTNVNGCVAEDAGNGGTSVSSTVESVDRDGQNSKLEAAPTSETLMNKLITQPPEVVEQMNNNTGQVVLLPNPHIPLLQLYGTNPLLAATGLDKYGMNSMQQVMLPGAMLDPQLCQNPAALAGGLNLLQMQQMWNSVGNGNLTNLNAIQLQTLQLQLLLQQLQGMQSLIQLHGTAPQTLPEEGNLQASDMAPGVPEGDECKEEEKEEESPAEGIVKEEDGLQKEESECYFEEKEKGDSKPTSSGTGFQSVEKLYTETKTDSQETKSFKQGNSSEKMSNPSLHNAEKASKSFSSKLSSDRSEVTSCPISEVKSSRMIPVATVAPKPHSAPEPVLKPEPGDNKLTQNTETPPQCMNHNGPEEDYDSDSLDDDISLDDLRRGLKRPRTDDETDVDSASMDNFDEESIDGLENDGFLQNFATGDVVWGQIRGFPLWPGKLVPESAAEGIELSPSLEDREDAVLVMWYGDHTFTRVEPHKLKTWVEGLEAHYKTRRKYRRGRKMNSHLEAAIQEAIKDGKDLPVISTESLSVPKPVPKGRVGKKRKT